MSNDPLPFWMDAFLADRKGQEMAPFDFTAKKRNSFQMIAGHIQFKSVWLNLFDFTAFSKVDEVGWHGCVIGLLMMLSTTERMEAIPILVLVGSA